MQGPITSEQLAIGRIQRCVACCRISEEEAIFLNTDCFAELPFIVLVAAGNERYDAFLYNPDGTGPAPDEQWEEGLRAVLSKLGGPDVCRCLRVVYIERITDGFRYILEFDILNAALRPVRRVETVQYTGTILNSPSLDVLIDKTKATLAGLAHPALTSSLPVLRFLGSNAFGSRFLREIMSYLASYEPEGTFNHPTVGDQFYRIYCQKGRLGGDIDLARGVTWRDQEQAVSINAELAPLPDALLPSLAGRSATAVIGHPILEDLTIASASIDRKPFQPVLQLTLHPKFVDIPDEFQPYWLKGKPFNRHSS